MLRGRCRRAIGRRRHGRRAKGQDRGGSYPTGKYRYVKHLKHIKLKKSNKKYLIFFIDDDSNGGAFSEPSNNTGNTGWILGLSIVAIVVVGLVRILFQIFILEA